MIMCSIGLRDFGVQVVNAPNLASLRPQSQDLAQNAQFARVIGVVVGDDVDLAQDVVLVLLAVGQRRE
jgi:hypothetical protein